MNRLWIASLHNASRRRHHTSIRVFFGPTFSWKQHQSLFQFSEKTQIITSNQARIGTFVLSSKSNFTTLIETIMHFRICGACTIGWIFFHTFQMDRIPIPYLPNSRCTFLLYSYKCCIVVMRCLHAINAIRAISARRKWSNGNSNSENYEKNMIWCMKHVVEIWENVTMYVLNCLAKFME